VPLDISEDDPNYAMFKGILERFGARAGEDDAAAEAPGDKGEIFYSDDDDIPEEEAEGGK
jgi:splicing factor 3B subunit 2